MEKLKAPFQYFGGKSAVADIIWERLGDVAHYIEPFAGSLAVLLQRPHKPNIESVNDIDCFLTNFWRAVRTRPDEVAEWADWPVSELDLHARHTWLVRQAKFCELLRSDPNYCDPKIAGWWVWGLSLWIGSGWCMKPDSIRRPNLLNRGTKRQRVSITNQSIQCDSKKNNLMDYFDLLSQRLKDVHILCGDWKRLVTPCMLETKIPTGVMLDPPYGEAANRDKHIYSCEDLKVATEVLEWCKQNGDNKNVRIALCGYEGEHDDLGSLGWEVYSWQAQGGMSNLGKDGQGSINRSKERIWFSSYCLKAKQMSLL